MRGQLDELIHRVLQWVNVTRSCPAGEELPFTTEMVVNASDESIRRLRRYVIACSDLASLQLDCRGTRLPGVYSIRMELSEGTTSKQILQGTDAGTGPRAQASPHAISPSTFTGPSVASELPALPQADRNVREPEQIVGRSLIRGARFCSLECYNGHPSIVGDGKTHCFRCDEDLRRKRKAEDAAGSVDKKSKAEAPGGNGSNEGPESSPHLNELLNSRLSDSSALPDGKKMNTPPKALHPFASFTEQRWLDEEQRQLHHQQAGPDADVPGRASPSSLVRRSPGSSSHSERASEAPMPLTPLPKRARCVEAFPSTSKTSEGELEHCDKQLVQLALESSAKEACAEGWKLNGGTPLVISPDELAITNSVTTFEAEEASRTWHAHFLDAISGMDEETVMRFRDGRSLIARVQKSKRVLTEDD